MKIAITGPDGAGKSSIGRILQTQLPRAELVYAGKADFVLPATAWALRLWSRARRLGMICSLPVQHLLYYPLEFLDSWLKFKQPCRDPERIIIFDRHPVDRIMMLHALRLKRARHRVSLPAFLLQLPLLWFWSKCYQWLFTRIEAVVILLPTAALCFERSGGQYPDLQEAEIRVQSYYLAIQDLGRFQKVFPVKITENDTLESLSNQILHIIQANISS